MESRSARVLRGLSAGSLATLVAAAGHGLSGGRAPGVAAVTLALAFAGLVSIALAGRSLSVPRLAASVVLSQLAFHVVFSTIGGAGEVVGSGHHGAAVITSGAEAVAHASGPMWLAHALAAVATVILIRHGEVAFFGIRDTGRMLLAALLRPPLIPLPVDHEPLPAIDSNLVPRIVRRSLEAVGTRGPPHALRGA